MHPTHTHAGHLDACLARGIWIDFYDPDGDRYGLPTYPWRCAPDGLLTIRQLRDKGLRPGGQDIAAQILWWHKGKRRVAYLYRIDLALRKRDATPRPVGGDRPGAGGPPHLPHLPDREGLLHPALDRRMQRLRGRGSPMMPPPAEHRSGVNRSLTSKRRRRVVENDDYAAFVQRVIGAYSRRVASGDIDALTGMAALSGDLDHAIAEAITALRTRNGYSWADIGTRLGITRQAAQQRWGGTSSTVTTPDGTGPTGSRP